MDKRIKMLLYALNKKGIDVSCMAKANYSEKFNTIITKYTLQFWYQGKRKKKGTDEEEKYTYAKIITPKNMMYTIKYLVAVKDNKAKAGESYDE